VPAAAPDSVYAPARNVPGANFVSANGENEKFVFYRGLGNFATNLRVTSEGGALRLHNRSPESVLAAFLVFSRGTHASITDLGNVPTGQVDVSAAVVEGARRNVVAYDEFIRSGTVGLKRALVASGLYEDEAKSMIDTWKTSYFRTPGLRVLYVLPRRETDSILPMTVRPAPKELERTLVGRVEVLLDTEEQALLSEIREKGYYFRVEGLGRLAEPKLRRIQQLTRVPADQAVLEQLIERVRAQ
jgi:hypothetical protein